MQLAQTANRLGPAEAFFNQLAFDLACRDAAAELLSGFILHAAADLSAMLTHDLARHDPLSVENWIALNAGLLPAEEMPERGTDILVNLMDGKIGS